MNESPGFAPPSKRAHMSLLYSGSGGHKEGDPKAVALVEKVRAEEGWMLEREFKIGSVKVIEFGGSFDEIGMWKEVWGEKVGELVG